MSTVTHTDDTGLDQLDPETSVAVDGTEFREIVAAREAVEADTERLREAVQRARSKNRSWTYIAVALGVSKQAAAKRFGDN